MEKYAKDPGTVRDGHVKVDYNEKMIRQQYEPMTAQEQYRIKMEALQEILDSGIDYCSCPEACPHHGKCWECVLIHRGHRDHLPYCFWDMINEKLYPLQRLTEGSLMKWAPHAPGSVPRQYGCPPECSGCEEKTDEQLPESQHREHDGEGPGAAFI